MVKYYLGSKGTYASSVKLLNGLIALIIMAIMGFAAIPSFLMVQANATKDNTSQPAGIQPAGFSSVTSGSSYPSIHSTENGRAQQPGLRRPRMITGYKKRVKSRPIVKKMDHVKIGTNKK